jgi:type I restriction enzyme, S subunit
MSTKLGSHISTQKGFAFKSKWYQDTGTPIVKVSDFTEDAIDTANLTYIPEEIGKEYQRYALHTHDVIIQTVGSWPNNPKSVVGKAIKVPKTANGALLNQNAVRLDPENDLDKKYLFYLLRNNHFTNYIVGCAQGAASQASITLEAIREYTFDLPVLLIQHKIASVLSAYDDLIEVNTRRICVLEAMAQSVYREWFGKVDEKSLPRGWKIITLGDIADKFTDKYLDEIHNKLPLLDLARIPRRSCNIPDFGVPSELTTSRIIFKKLDVLFGSLHPYFHKVVFAPFDGVTNTSVFVIRPTSEKSMAFLFSLLFLPETVAWANQHSGGTKMPVINWEVFSKMPIVLPEENIVRKFNDLIEPLLQSIANIVLRNANLRRTRNLVLPYLVSGGIELELENE